MKLVSLGEGGGCPPVARSPAPRKKDPWLGDIGGPPRDELVECLRLNLDPRGLGIPLATPSVRTSNSWAAADPSSGTTAGRYDDILDSDAKMMVRRRTDPLPFGFEFPFLDLVEPDLLRALRTEAERFIAPDPRAPDPPPPPPVSDSTTETTRRGRCRRL